MATQYERIHIFQDTQRWYQENPILAQAIRRSIEHTVLYGPSDYPALPPAVPGRKTTITVSQERSFEGAMRLIQENPDQKTAVHNFASATHPGGGVVHGSGAQEECLCRCSTLYPVLDTPDLWRRYYQFHQKRRDRRYTDSVIYSPNILIIKSDTDYPERLPEEAWETVDVITCAAPNLRRESGSAANSGRGQPANVSNEELLALHQSRARHMLACAAAQGAQMLVLGAFGCGAFQNSPEIVAQAYRNILPEFEGRFTQILFAVYTSAWDARNYEAFRRVLG